MQSHTDHTVWQVSASIMQDMDALHPHEKFALQSANQCPAQDWHNREGILKLKAFHGATCNQSGR